MNLLSVIGNGLLNKPGDRLEARITKSGRRVAKLFLNNGATKHSITQYGNGTIVRTTVQKFK